VVLGSKTSHCLKRGMEGLRWAQKAHRCSFRVTGGHVEYRHLPLLKTGGGEAVLGAIGPPSLKTRDEMVVVGSNTSRRSEREVERSGWAKKIVAKEERILATFWYWYVSRYRKIKINERTSSSVTRFEDAKLQTPCGGGVVGAKGRDQPYVWGP
jgi:hypothetical protein